MGIDPTKIIFLFPFYINKSLSPLNKIIAFLYTSKFLFVSLKIKKNFFLKAHKLFPVSVGCLSVLNCNMTRIMGCCWDYHSLSFIYFWQPTPEHICHICEIPYIARQNHLLFWNLKMPDTPFSRQTLQREYESWPTLPSISYINFRFWMRH